jgi:hypothetical protein
VRFLWRALCLAAAGLVLAAGPAGADPAEPGDYSSEVTAIDPDVGGFSIDVSGGDAFLEVSVEDGHEVIVLGYDDEPYLRFAEDGTVERNRNSPATYLNDDRFAEVTVPDDLGNEPDWEEVADGGSYAWHDHRVHLMAAEPPPDVGRGDTFPWSGVVPLEVDGTPVEVTGEITFEDDVVPPLWFGLAALVALAVGGAGGRLGRRGLAATLTGVALLAAVVAWAPYADAPAGAGASVVPVVLAVLSVVAGVTALAVGERPAAVATLAGAVLIGTWAVFRLGVLTNPVLPTPLPYAFDRGVTALAIGTGVGTVVALFRSGVLEEALVSGSPLASER